MDSLGHLWTISSLHHTTANVATNRCPATLRRPMAYA